MTNLENIPKSAGKIKVDEYVERIKSGESKESIYEGLSEAFKKGIESKLFPITPEEEFEILDKNEILDIRSRLGLVEPFEDAPLLDIESRKKLFGWSASYELAKIAKNDEVDLSKLSREDYVDYAIKNGLAIDDDQLRVAPWQRTATSVNEIVLKNREERKKINYDSETNFARFTFETKEQANTDNRSISENIKIRQGTKDSDSWLFFGINNGVESDKSETYKSYISVKDLNTLTPERLKTFMVSLRDSGYNGDLKIFQDLTEQGVRLNDQVVMHGSTKEDSELALRVADEFFGEDISEKSFGKDEVVDGVNKSYSQILAKKIKDSLK